MLRENGSLKKKCKSESSRREMTELDILNAYTKNSESVFSDSENG